MGVKLDDRFTWSGGVPTYRIHGQLSHRIGSLLPEQTGGQCRPMFAQLYILFGVAGLAEVGTHGGLHSGLRPRAPISS
jgi:hypothetical protein